MIRIYLQKRNYAFNALISTEPSFAVMVDAKVMQICRDLMPIDWLDEHLTGECQYGYEEGPSGFDNGGPFLPVYIARFTPYIEFSNRDDAIMYKLTWGGAQ